MKKYLAVFAAMLTVSTASLFSVSAMADENCSTVSQCLGGGSSPTFAAGNTNDDNGPSGNDDNDSRNGHDNDSDSGHDGGNGDGHDGGNDGGNDGGSDD